MRNRLAHMVWIDPRDLENTFNDAERVMEVLVNAPDPQGQAARAQEQLQDLHLQLQRHNEFKERRISALGWSKVY